jgi:hypothetical protein
LDFNLSANRADFNLSANLADFNLSANLADLLILSLQIQSVCVKSFFSQR